MAIYYNKLQNYVYDDSITKYIALRINGYETYECSSGCDVPIYHFYKHITTSIVEYDISIGKFNELRECFGEYIKEIDNEEKESILSEWRSKVGKVVEYSHSSAADDIGSDRACEIDNDNLY